MLKKTAKRTCAGIMSLAFVLGTFNSVPAIITRAAADVTINEVCPKNSTFASPDGNYYDWIELYNSSGSSVDVGGWGITDKADKPYRFTIPTGTVIPAGGRKVIFCDGTAGETDTSIAPFGLSTSGETLTLTDTSGNIASQITFGDMAKDTSYGQYPDGSGEFYVLSTSPNEPNKAPEGSNAVRTPEFSAESGFYDNSFSLTIGVPEGTTVYYTLDGSDPTTASEKYTSPLSIQDMTSQPNKLSARTDITAYTDILAPDEGVLKAAVVRAVAVDAQGRTSSTVTKTYFVGSTNVEKYKNIKVISLVTDPNNLFDYEKGIYVLGKVYDEGGGGMGFGGFNFGGFGAPEAQSSEPETTSGEEAVIEEEAEPETEPQTEEPTAETTEAAADEEEDVTEEVTLGDVSFEEIVKTNIEAPEDETPQGGWGGFNFGGQNGDNGDGNNNGWGGFNFGDQNGEAGGWNPGGGDGGWNPGGGMGDFAFMSQANYNQKGAEWERPANIEIFDGGKSVVSQDVGIRTKGAASRAWAQKSFNIFSRQDYGKSSVEYDLFEGKSTKEKNGKVIDTFDGFTVRNGGNDNMAGFFRDSVNQSLVSDRDMATQATSECILFIDGEFWGIYQLMEKYNTDYFKSHYGVKKNDVAYIKNNTLEDGSDQDLTEWNSLLSQIASGDMTSDAAYREVCEKLDIQSFIDYFAAQIYWGNHDWPSNNTGVWRANTVDPENPYADGKWRMVLFDTEYSSNLADKVNEVGPTYNTFSQFAGGGMGGWGFGMGGGGSLSGAFTALMKNEDFKKQFELSFMDMANYNFDTKKTTEAINYYKGFKQQILDTYKRFPSSKHTHNEATFDEDYQLLETFYNTRYGNITGMMKSFMNLTGSLASVSVSNDGTKGSIKFNTIKLDDSLSTWSGQYFTDYPVTVKAEAKEGYSFDHWEVTGANVSDTTSDEITVPVSEGVSVKAVYKEGGTPMTTTPKTEQITTTTTTVKTEFKINYGDANLDGSVALSDAVLIMQSIANPSAYGQNGTNPDHITAEGARNADVTGHNDGVTNSDALAIQKYCLKLITQLPEE
ncbi:MAG: CotH kinase family protein [Ruminococcus sp.]|nr:CotH kinase family protein [Ruminococcus sp.]